MKQKIGMITILMFIFHITYAQQRNISIIDDATGEAIVGAHFKASKQKNLKGAKTIISDKDGKVKLNIGGTLYYSVNALGFSEKKGIINEKLQKATIRMEELSLDLEQVVVTGSRTPKPIKQSPVMIQVISGTKLAEAAFPGIKEALMQEMPGLNFKKVGFGTDINVSGLDARHILFLIDGERMTGEMAGNLDYERFNLHSIQRIEIVKGASSTMYGSRAAGAVINLISKKTIKKFDLDAGVRYGQWNERNYKNALPEDFMYMFEKNVDRPNVQSWLSLGSKLGKFTSQTDVLYSSEDAYNLFQSGRDVKLYPADPSIGLMNDTTLIAHHDRPALGIEGSENINVSQKLFYDYNNNLSFELYGNYFFMNSYDMVKDLVFNQTRDINGGLKMKYKWKNYMDISLSFHGDYYTRHKRHERRDVTQKIYDSKIIQPRIFIQSNYFDKHTILGGFEYYKDELETDRFKRDVMEIKVAEDLEYFLQDEYAVNEKATIIGGFRTSYDRFHGFKFTPKIALKYNATDNLIFRLNYAEGYRTASIKEKYFDWDHMSMFHILGDPALKPEQNRYYSFSTEYYTSNLFFSGNIYSNVFKNKIEGVWRVYDFQYNFEYRNFAKNTINGFDLLGRVKLLNNLNVNFSYSFTDVSKYGAAQLNTSSPHNANFGLEHKFGTKNVKLTSNFAATLTGSKKYSIQDRLTVNGKIEDAFFEAFIPAYTMCNMSFIANFYNRTEITVGANNLFNYRPKMLGSGVTMFNIPATPGMRLFVQLAIKLNK